MGDGSKEVDFVFKQETKTAQERYKLTKERQQWEIGSVIEIKDGGLQQCVL